MKKSFKVTLEVPQGVSPREIRDHIRDSVVRVQTSPYLILDRANVTVTSIPEPLPQPTSSAK